MTFLVQGVKILVSLAVAWLGYIVLDPQRWPLVQQVAPLQIPPAFYEMRIERLGVGAAILLLGTLCALSAAVSAVRRP